MKRRKTLHQNLAPNNKKRQRAMAMVMMIILVTVTRSMMKIMVMEAVVGLLLRID